MDALVNREVRLKRRPRGIPEEEDFELANTSIEEPREGEVLVRNIYMSVDPYMRGRMNENRNAEFGAFRPGECMEGAALGQVALSRNDKFAKESFVMSMQGWREYFLSDGSDLERIDPGPAPLRSYLGALGMPGFTAYVGLEEIGRCKPGDSVLVSAAAGAVGQIACQIAKMKGCYVVGSAGTEEKKTWLEEEAKIDAAFNYKDAENPEEPMAHHLPRGIDLYFDNVGGGFLEAALEKMNPHGRVVLCGMISQYNDETLPSGPRNLFLAIMKRLTLRGFLVFDHYDKLPEFQALMKNWMLEGKMKWRETILNGIENAPRAFLGLFDGRNQGKMLVRLALDPTM